MHALLQFAAVASTEAATDGGLAPVYWHWWIVGLLLMSVEAFAPGAFFLWLGLSALVVGTALSVLPELSLTTQMFIYAVLVFVSAAAWWRLRRRGEVREPAVTPLNDRASWYRGRVFTLDSPVINGIGQLRVDDGQWRVSGPDLPVGTQVRVHKVIGTTLHIEPLPGNPNGSA